MQIDRLFRTIIHTASISLIVLLIGSYLLAQYIGYRAERELIQRTGHPWQVSLRSIWCNPISGTLSLNNIFVESKGSLSINIKRVVIDDIFNIALESEISLGEIEILFPTIEIESREHLRQLSGQLEIPIYIEKINIQGATLIEQKSEIITAANLSLEQISITEKQLVAHNIEGNSSQNSIEVSTIRLDGVTERASIEDLSLKPIYSINHFLAGGIWANWNSIFFTTIEITDIDIDALIKERNIIIDSILVERGKIESYKNRRAVAPTRVKPLLYQWLHSFNREIKIGHITFNEINITYNEIDINSSTPGHISFDRLYGSIRGIDNSAPIGSLFTIDAAARVAEGAEATIQIDMPNNRADDNFSATGTLGTTALSRFNTITIPLLHTKIESGRLNSLAFTITGNSHSSKSNLTMLYDSLKVTILKDRAGRYSPRELLTAVSNRRLRGSNPIDDMVYRGEGSFVRDSLKSQFNYLWRSLESAIKATIITSSKER